MKRFLISAAAVAAFAFTGLVSAQTFETVHVHFDQPFTVAGTQLQEGDYTIAQIPGNGDLPLLRISADHGSSVFAFAARDIHAYGQSAAQTEVVLDKSGPVEQLTRIRVEGSDTDLVFQTAPAH